MKKERVSSYGGFEQVQRPKPQNLSSFFAPPKKSTVERPKIEPYQIGDRIKHITFGEGTVMNVSPMSSDFMYEIAFDNVGTKKLMATYVAKLMKKI